MYLPRALLSHLYTHLLRTTHPLSPPVLLLVALEPDALCACRILTALLKRDYIPHKIQPIAGYNDLSRAGEELVRPMRTTDGGSGGIVVCLGVGGLVDLEDFLGMEEEVGGAGGVDVWVVDSRRPWNLANVFGGGFQNVQEDGEGAPLVKNKQGIEQGRVLQSFKPGAGGIVVFDDGDIEDELAVEKEAYWALAQMPQFDEDEGADEDLSDEEESKSEQDLPMSGQAGRKRKSLPDDDDGMDSEEEFERPKQRRRSNSSSSLPSTPERPARRGLLTTSNQHTTSSDFSRNGTPESRSSPPMNTAKHPSARTLRRRLLKLRRKHESVIQEYSSLGTSYSEPISSLMYSLASDLGREDNDLLWNAIVGVSSLELYGRTLNGVGISPLSTAGGSSGWNGDRGERIRAVLRDEVRRLNPTDLKDIAREASLGDSGGVIQTHARSPTDMSIRLSPEPRFLLIRHWSLYESMLHSPYLSARLHIWNDSGRRRLHKLLAKMGVSLTQCKQSYTHMDMELKRGLRERLLKFAPVYGLDGLVPPVSSRNGDREGWGFVRCWGWKACLSAVDISVVIGAILEAGGASISTSSSDNPPNPEDEADTESVAQEQITARFWTAYDALGSVDKLTSHISTAQHLYRAILRTGTSLIEKKQIRHLRAFRMAVVKEGPDVQLFTHPGALTKLALWISEAIAEQEGIKRKGKGGELVVAGLDEARGVYVVVGLGGGGGVAISKEKEKRKAEKRKEKEKKKEARKLEKDRERQARRDRRAANGDLEESDEEDEETEEESDDSDSESEDGEVKDTIKKRGHGKNRFGHAFSEVIEETGARVKIDSFEHCVVEVKKEDLSGFLESLSMKAVVG
ncbi:CDC45-like protein [Patellaria atrata CBS 101060]|uniref:CDC45-like protein n=1 Tax=Patellaria atrata CBS 101060 TaxID=1346257 RepID=A0A9P4SCC1_9PEZI|nr:CDC45-like protein [Patellaria atrata CBS 101060]